MQSYQFHQLFDQQMCLLPEKCIFWPAQQMLIVADVHLGKVMHFRKAGIPIPTAIIKKDLVILQKLMIKFSPKRVLFLGDLFHSHMNTEWHLFEGMLEQFSECSFELALGNHDDYTKGFMRERLKVYERPLVIPPFCFTHIPLEKHEIPSGTYNLSGHLHPGVRLKGRGKQVLQLPCFFFGVEQGVLPAFGGFTGFVPIKVGPSDQVFPIIEGKVVQV